MKKTLVLTTLLAIALAAGLVLAGCSQPTNDDKSSGTTNTSNTSFGDEGKLSEGEQVYTVTYEDNTVKYTAYTGNLTLNDGMGETATITGGKFSYTFGTPDYFYSWVDLSNYYFSSYDDVNATNEDVQAYIIYDFYNYEDHGDNTYTSYSLYRENQVNNIGTTSGTSTYEQVMYVYVDRDVTITGKGKTDPYTYEDVTYTYKTTDFRLELKKGWNTVYTKNTSSATYPSNHPENATNVTSTETMSISNPSSLKWVLSVYNGSYSPPPEPSILKPLGTRNSRVRR